MAPTPEKSALLEREDGLRRPAAIASIVGGVLVLYLTITLLGEHESTDAGRLTKYAADAGKLKLASIIGMVGYLLLAPPLYFVLNAARTRGIKIITPVLVLAAIGPVLLGAGTTVSLFESASLGKQFADQAPAAVKKAEAEQKAAAKKAAAKKTAPAGKTDTGTKAAGKTGAGKAGADQTNAASQDTSPPPTGDAAGSPRDTLAKDLFNNSTTSQLAFFPSVAGLLSLLFVSFHAARVAMRSGLLTRFTGTLGMALSLVSALAQPLLPIWFVILGMTLLGLMGGLPPAWAAGEAMPWPDRRGPRTPVDPGTPADRATELEKAGLPPDTDASPAGETERHSEPPKRDEARGPSGPSGPDDPPDPDDPYADVAS